MSERYREGYEYVVCDECGSHFLLDSAYLHRMFDPEDPEVTERWLGFTCDNDECEADCSALVRNPYLDRPACPMLGGETGEDETGGLSFIDCVALIVDLCTADDARWP